MPLKISPRPHQEWILQGKLEAVFRRRFPDLGDDLARGKLDDFDTHWLAGVRDVLRAQGDDDLADLVGQIFSLASEGVTLVVCNA